MYFSSKTAMWKCQHNTTSCNKKKKTDFNTYFYVRDNNGNSHQNWSFWNELRWMNSRQVIKRENICNNRVNKNEKQSTTCIHNNYPCPSACWENHQQKLQNLMTIKHYLDIISFLNDVWVIHLITQCLSHHALIQLGLWYLHFKSAKSNVLCVTLNMNL